MTQIHDIFGQAGHAEKYDLPLHKRLGTEFISTLMTLMTVLCFICVTLFLSLQHFSNSWTEGLAKNITIELPFETQSSEIETLSNQLKNISQVKSVKQIEANEIKALLSPWLGNTDLEVAQLPLPILLSVDLKERDEATLKSIKEIMLSHGAKADLNEEWLQDLMTLAHSVIIGATMLLAAIGMITALTISGAVRSRMAIHQRELELLHIMGADDRYISKQFQRYITRLCLRGVVAGSVIFVVLLAIFWGMNMRLPDTLPHLTLSPLMVAGYGLTAFILLLISQFTARQTSIAVLKEMP